MKIILASQSPSRARLLSKTGLAFKVFSPHIDEKRFLNPKKPGDSCLFIAKQKALKAQALYKREIIIACDQMAYLEGRFFGKAHTIKKAIENLTKLSGKTHTLFSGLCLLWEDKKLLYLCQSHLSMRALSQQEIKSYVLKEKPLKSAGSYHIESQGIKLFEKIQTEDFNAIEGLPLIQVINQLAKWNSPLFKL